MGCIERQVILFPTLLSLDVIYCEQDLIDFWLLSNSLAIAETSKIIGKIEASFSLVVWKKVRNVGF